MIESDTPRTDAEQYTVIRSNLWGESQGETTVVDPDFARSLERSLIAAQARIAEIEKVLERAKAFIIDGEPERPDTYRMNNVREAEALEAFWKERDARRVEEASLIQVIETALSVSQTS